jgi:hypothetical protein
MSPGVGSAKPTRMGIVCYILAPVLLGPQSALYRLVCMRETNSVSVEYACFMENLNESRVGPGRVIVTGRLAEL